jgi:hypothetical protein
MSKGLQISFTLPDNAAQLMLRLANCIREAGEGTPSVDDIARSLIIELLIDDAQAHGVIDRPRLVS